MVELDREPESPRGLLLEPLEEVDRLPQRAGDVAHVVVGVRALERGERARDPPSARGSAVVPGVDDGSTARACHWSSVTSRTSCTVRADLHGEHLAAASFFAAQSAWYQKSLASSVNAAASA